MSDASNPQSSTEPTDDTEYPERRTIIWVDDVTGVEVGREEYVRADLLEAAEAALEGLEESCSEWAEVSQNNYQRAKAAEAALGQLLDQVYQMQGMFPDEDGAIARAVADAEMALDNPQQGGDLK